MILVFFAIHAGRYNQIDLAWPDFAVSRRHRRCTAALLVAVLLLPLVHPAGLRGPSNGEPGNVASRIRPGERLVSVAPPSIGGSIAGCGGRALAADTRSLRTLSHSGSALACRSWPCCGHQSDLGLQLVLYRELGERRERSPKRELILARGDDQGFQAPILSTSVSEALFGRRPTASVTPRTSAFSSSAIPAKAIRRRRHCATAIWTLAGART
jgi:hypothetical protein